MSATYSTKLTANTSQHDAALKKSAGEVYKYKSQVEKAKGGISGMAKSFGPLAAQIGIATGALATMKAAIVSTEAGADKFNEVMAGAKTAVTGFFASLTTGNLQSFVSGMDDMVRAAREAYKAFDQLGTIMAFSNPVIAEKRMQIERWRTIALDPRQTKEAREYATKQIAMIENEIKAINEEIIQAGNNAIKAGKNAVAGTDVIDQKTFDKLLEMKKNGTLAQYAEQYRDKHSDVGGFWSDHWLVRKWESEYDQALYNAMVNIQNASEADGSALAQYLQARTDQANRQADMEREIQRQNKLEVKVEGSTTPKTTTPKTTTPSAAAVEGSLDWYTEKIALIQKKIDELNKKKLSIPYDPVTFAKIDLAIEEANGELEKFTDEKRKAELTIQLGPDYEQRLKDAADRVQSIMDAMNPPVLHIEPNLDMQRSATEGLMGAIDAAFQKEVENMENELDELKQAWADAETDMERSDIAKLIDELIEKMMEFSETPFETKARQISQEIEEVKDSFEGLSGTFGSVSSALGSVASAYSAMGDEESAAVAKQIQGFAEIANGISQLLPTIGSLIAANIAESTANNVSGASKLEPWPVKVAAIAAAIAQMIAIGSTIWGMASDNKFAQGGVVAGGHYAGDNLYARVNSGEMILNQGQQGRLFRMLNQSVGAVSGSTGGEVVFRINGSTLEGVLDNRNRKMRNIK